MKCRQRVCAVFGRPFLQRFSLCYGTVVMSVCNVGVLWPNGWVDQAATWYGGRSRPRPHWVRWEPSSPHRKGHSSPPLFGPCLLWPNGRPAQLLLSYCFTQYQKSILKSQWDRRHFAPLYPSQILGPVWMPIQKHITTSAQEVEVQNLIQLIQQLPLCTCVK